jgi:alkanesulfonate monooxygenase SsuD/methylene tetrahydromethanopterin reductase-like flavin-dependent oxidoreductase (luciferase family)
MQGTFPSFDSLAQHIEFYRSCMGEALAPYDQNPAFGRADAVRMVYVAPTDRQAKEESEAGITRHMKSFLGGGAGRYLGDVAEKRGEDDFAYDKLAKTTLLHGSPDTVIRRIEKLRSLGVTSVMVHYPPYYGPERTLAMLRLFAKEVLPHVQAAPAPKLKKGAA